MRLRGLIGLLIGGVVAFPVSAEEITVAVASNFTAAMNEIVTEFEAASGHEVRVAFGSSGKFYAQITHGAPFQAFFSADRAKAAALESDGLAVPGSRFTYAIGTLALWSRKPDVVDDEASVLKQGRFNKLALANPRLAPYGAAAVEVLQNLDLVQQTRSRWVQGENVAQTWQFVSTGNADLGFVALSQIMSRREIGTGSAWVVPKHLYSPIRQDAVLLRDGENSAATRALLRFVRDGKGAAIIAANGYHTPTDEPR